MQAPSLKKQGGGCCIWGDEIELCHFSSEKPILAHGKPTLGHVFSQVKSLGAVSFSKEQKRKQEDLFPSKWRNIDVDPGMK